MFNPETISAVRQLVETNAVDEANQFLRDGWILINTFTTEFGTNYVLGKTVH